MGRTGIVHGAWAQAASRTLRADSSWPVHVCMIRRLYVHLIGWSSMASPGTGYADTAYARLHKSFAAPAAAA
jgi:hypothetical protein